ncbi:MAG: hypothetical protein ACFFDW_01815 [Candidatus Thorarchaeota archaeon]
MASSQNNDSEIQELAKSLIEKDRKKALSIIRQRLNASFDVEYEMLVWKGWERALNRQENSALISRLVDGIPEDDAKEIFKDLKRQKTEILIRDHTQTDLSKHYISNWLKLLEYYCSLY